MKLVKWNPLNDMFNISKPTNYLFDDVFSPLFRRDDSSLSQWSWHPTIDIFDNDDNIVIKAELPGINKKDIAIDVKNGVLTLQGERNFDNEVKEEKYYRRERAFGKFKRSFRLPLKVDPGKINANYKDGILTIDIPKPEEQKPKQITVH